MTCIFVLQKKIIGLNHIIGSLSEHKKDRFKYFQGLSCPLSMVDLNNKEE
jgi:hypothetical protein